MPPSRNAPCPCGSQKRYKDCHGTLASLRTPAAANDASASDAPAAQRLKATLDRALAHQMRGEATAAEACYREALDEHPGHFDALHMLGALRYQQGDHDEAVDLLTRAIAVNAHHAPAHSNLGLALHAQKHLAHALASFERALSLQPDYAEAHNNRGTVLQEMTRHEEALASFDRALALRPESVEILSNRANALLELRRYEEAAACFSMLVAKCADYDWAIGYLHQCRMHCCDWTEQRALSDRIDAAVRAGRRAITPFAYLATSASPSDQLQCARIFAVAGSITPGLPPAVRDRRRDDKIRLAYLSADFREHPVAFLAAGLFELHDRSRFHVTAVSFGPDSESETRQRLQRAFDAFLDVRARSDLEVAQILREREIDIAVDLMGYTNGSRPRILAHRPCPIQVSYLGYPGTMGSDSIDYLLADAHVIPPGDERFYAEKVVRLPDTYMVNDSKRAIAPSTPPRAEFGLPEAAFVFCCFNNSYKITPQVFDIWMRLLAAVPGSVLWLFGDNALAARNLRREAAARHVAPERLVFARRVEMADHLARHRLADLFLDTLPYNAHTTACDALWSGLPVLTCAGRSFAGRVASGLLAAIGLPELVTDNPADYEALALDLARAPHRLREIRTRLSAHIVTHPLFDTRRFRAHIETAYGTMWARYERGEAPAGFDVAPVDAGHRLALPVCGT